MTAHSLGTVEAADALIKELYLDLREKVHRWSAITKQTSQARMGYVGQHLVSVVTGFPGGKSGARGYDIIYPDKTFGEIKTCYRVDQLGKCESCGAVVASTEVDCAACGSKELKRNDDSKWLISIRNEAEFQAILEPKCYYLVLFEFADLELRDSINAFIWTVDPLSPGFALCMVDYYQNIRSRSASKAPFNLWPYSLKFELMKPKLIYKSTISSDNSIKTLLFPTSPAQEWPLANLQDHAKSRGLSDTKIMELLARSGLGKDRILASRNWRLVSLQKVHDALKSMGRTNADICDLLARVLYSDSVKSQLPQLPKSIRPHIGDCLRF